jgi:subtilase family serine protease
VKDESDIRKSSRSLFPPGNDCFDGVALRSSAPQYLEYLGNKMRLRVLFSRILLILSMLFTAGLAPDSAHAQAMTAISGNHPAMIPLGWPPSPDSQHIDLTAVLALRNTGQLANLESDLQNRDSPSYHKWLTTDAFAAQFGPTSDEVSAVVSWLTDQGFQIAATDQRTRRVSFSGTVGTIRHAFATSIVSDGTNYVNTSDPVVPAELAQYIQAILGLSSLPRVLNSDARQATARGNSERTLLGLLSDETINDLGPNFAPSDLYTFYNEVPVLNGGNKGTRAPDCVGLPELGDVTNGALLKFNGRFKLPPVSLTKILVNRRNPGLPEDNEPALDVEWVHAVSPRTPIYVYLADSTTPYLDAITRAVDDNKCGAISGSVEDSCPDVATLDVYNSELEQGVVQGQTFFHSSGDYGDNWYCGNVIPVQPVYNQSNCDKVPSNGTGSQPSVDEEAASPFLTSVGGTQFTPIYLATFDASVVGDSLEVAWNEAEGKSDNCPVKDSGGGGKSVVFAKPAWQTGLNVPSDGARDVPDISMGADGNAPGFFVYSQVAGSRMASLVATGGTSIASPMWAAISRLIAQSQGVTRLGNINPRLYELGNLQSTASGLHDVISGNNDDGGIPGYSAGPGYDQVTGWGSPNIALLVAAFQGAALSAKESLVKLTRGASAETGAFSVANTTTDPLQITGITLDITSPKLLSSVQVSATVVGVTQKVTEVPSRHSAFVFPSPLVIPTSQAAEITLTLTAAKTRGSSVLSVLSGSISVNDGQGGIIVVTGLPRILASVTVQ